MMLWSMGHPGNVTQGHVLMDPPFPIILASSGGGVKINQVSDFLICKMWILMSPLH